MSQMEFAISVINSSVNREVGFFLIRLWKSLIHILEEQKETVSKNMTSS